ncbi:MAG TPA: Rieske (2Fe-2S) protein [Tepidisphaeraceae bacterium]|jgi:Rieske Fe-S protein|nr:Rieske (2Fe-2S) protein [Tepidisphaeraceae bacterium]
MQINRRDFVLLTAVTVAGCKSADSPSTPTLSRTVDAGPASQYADEGIYDRFRLDGFFLVNDGGNLFALSSVCTHRECRLRPQEDHTFFCKCHGSRFDENGKVTKGPATRDLPHFATSTNDSRHLIVQVVKTRFDEE